MGLDLGLPLGPHPFMVQPERWPKHLEQHTQNCPNATASDNPLFRTSERGPQHTSRALYT